MGRLSSAVLRVRQKANSHTHADDCAQEHQVHPTMCPLCVRERWGSFPARALVHLPHWWKRFHHRLSQKASDRLFDAIMGCLSLADLRMAGVPFQTLACSAAKGKLVAAHHHGNGER